MKRFNSLLVVALLLLTFAQISQRNAPFLQKAEASSYNCGNVAIGNIACNNYLGTIHCNISGSLGVNGTAGCTDSLGNTVYCSSNFLFGGMSVDCPPFPLPKPTPTPTPTGLYSWPTPIPTPTPTSNWGNGFPVPVPLPTFKAPSCTSAPTLPVLTYIQDSNGITFTITPASGGQPVSTFTWNYSLWDDQNSAWDNWSGWKFTNDGSAFTKRFEKQANKTRIVFSVEAGNDCGMTEQVRESIDHKGVSIGESTLTQIISFPYFLPDVKLSVGTLTINATATSALAVSYRSTNPGVCNYGNQLLHLYSSGTCTLIFSQPGNSEYKPAPDVQVHFEVLPSEPVATESKLPKANLLQQSIYVIPLKAAYKISEKSVLMRTGTDANLQVNAVSKNPKICNVFNEYQPTAFSVEFYKKGTCILTLTQSGNSLYKVAPKKLVTFKIT